MKIFKTLALALCAAICHVNATAQVPNEKVEVDLTGIEVDVIMHPEQYRALLERFESADTTLTLQQVATVYYGHAATFDYDPTIDYSAIGEKIAEADYEGAYHDAVEALKTNPLSLRLTVDGILAAAKSRNLDYIDTLGNLQKRFDMLVNTIFLSGRGIVPESPFHVISRSDISTLLHDVLGVNKVLGTSKILGIDAYKVTFPGSMREHILYFDNTPQDRFGK